MIAPSPQNLHFQNTATKNLTQHPPAPPTTEKGAQAAALVPAAPAELNDQKWSCFTQIHGWEYLFPQKPAPN